MGFQVEENTNFARFKPHFASVEHRPMLLKDFLKDDGQWSTVAAKSNKLPHIVLLRSWSKRAAATKISALHKVIKLLHFASSIKTPSALPRKFNKRGKTDILEVKVKVKDILRWRSFRDLAEDEPSPLDYPRSPDRSAAASSCSKRSSCCDSGFTAEELPPWGGENYQDLKNTKGDWSFEEYDQQSPVSVLDSPFRQVKEFISPTSTNNFQRLTRTNNFEEEEEGNATDERAKQLVEQVMEDGDGVILDFISSEASKNGKLNDDEFNGEILKIAKSWLDGELEDSYKWEVEEKRGSFVKDMERGICWKNFREEEQELCKEMEISLLNDFLDDFVVDFLN